MTFRLSLTRRSLLALALGALTALAVAVPPALAASLDAYRAEGVIAERFDGLVEIRVDNPPAEAEQIVEQVNDKRRKIYEKRANEQGVPPEAVGKVYAKQIMQDAPAGTYLRKPDGGYVQK